MDIKKTRFINKLRKIKHFLIGVKLFNVDRKRFSKSTFKYNTNKKQHLLAQISIHYHSIEKGLTNVNFREGFGINALSGLLNSLTKYEVEGYDKNNGTYLSGLNTIKNYISRHEKTSVNTRYLVDFLNERRSFLKNSSIKKIYKKELFELINSNPETFIKSRRSVRDYSKKNISNENLYDAIELSRNTPSVCNRQPWLLHIIEDQELIMKTLSVQKGFNNYGDNISHLLLVTSDNRNFGTYSDRNQGFIDAGMYSMNLLLSLHAKKIAACALNAAFSHKVDSEIRKILDIKYYENLIMFIAIGTFNEIVISANSHKKEIKDLVVKNSLIKKMG